MATEKTVKEDQGSVFEQIKQTITLLRNCLFEHKEELCDQLERLTRQAAVETGKLMIDFGSAESQIGKLTDEMSELVKINLDLTQTRDGWSDRAVEEISKRAQVEEELANVREDLKRVMIEKEFIVRGAIGVMEIYGDFDVVNGFKNK